MHLHLDEIATKVTPGAHAILVLDQAGWHGAKALVVPSNISLVPLPPRAPELNGQENIWQFMPQNWLSNRIFKSFDPVSIIADAADGADGIFETPAYPDDPAVGVVCTVAATKEPNFAQPRSQPRTSAAQVRSPARRE